MIKPKDGEWRLLNMYEDKFKKVQTYGQMCMGHKLKSSVYSARSNENKNTKARHNNH